MRLMQSYCDTSIPKETGAGLTEFREGVLPRGIERSNALDLRIFAAILVPSQQIESQIVEPHAGHWNRQ